jgi:hypothetical protein
MVANLEKSVADDGFQDVQSPQPFEKSSAESQPGNSDSGFNNIMQNIKVKVLKMVSNASNYHQNLFGLSSAESTSSDANGNTFLNSSYYYLFKFFWPVCINIIAPYVSIKKNNYYYLCQLLIMIVKLQGWTSM